jgi:hypothetical protein
LGSINVGHATSETIKQLPASALPSSSGAAAGLLSTTWTKAISAESLFYQQCCPPQTVRTMAVNTLVIMETFYLYSVRYVCSISLAGEGVLGTRAVTAGASGL